MASNNITVSSNTTKISVTTGDGKTKVLTATPIAIAGSPGASGDIASQTGLMQIFAGVCGIQASLQTTLDRLESGIQGGYW